MFFLSWLESSPPRDSPSHIGVKLVPWGTCQLSVGSKPVPQGTGPDKVALRHVPWGTTSHFESVVTLTPLLKVTFSPKMIESQCSSTVDIANSLHVLSLASSIYSQVMTLYEPLPSTHLTPQSRLSTRRECSTPKTRQPYRYIKPYAELCPNQFV